LIVVKNALVVMNSLLAQLVITFRYFYNCTSFEKQQHYDWKKELGVWPAML